MLLAGESQAPVAKKGKKTPKKQKWRCHPSPTPLLSDHRLWIVPANRPPPDPQPMNPPDPAPAPPATSAPPQPTGARHWVLAFAATLAVITYIDRVCMSQAKGWVAPDLGLDKVQMGYVFAASTGAYAVFGVLGGWLGDRIGPRKVLTYMVLLWSLFTAATGLAWTLAFLVMAQFFFGAAEAGVFPNLAKAYSNWLPAREQNRAVSLMWLCTRWGGAITPLLVVWVISNVGWRWAFSAFAAPGLVWAALYYWWFRDHPRDHRGVNAAELELINKTPPKAAGKVEVPWSKILLSRTVWLLVVQYFCFGYGWYFYITWLPTYAKDALNLDLKKSALLSGIPLFFGGFACVLSGWLAGWLVRRGFALVRVRRNLAFVGYGGGALMVLLCPHIANPVWAMVVMGLASFSLDLTLPLCWRTAMDVGGKCAGTVSASMNTAGQIGGAVGPVVVGYIVQYTSNWKITFAITAAIYVIGGLCWIWIDPVTPLDKGE
jgi:MFS family permease